MEIFTFPFLFLSCMYFTIQVQIFKGFLSTYSSGTRNRSVCEFSEITKQKPE